MYNKSATRDESTEYFRNKILLGEYILTKEGTVFNTKTNRFICKQNSEGRTRKLNAVENKTAYNITLSRLMWVIFVGPIPDNHVVAFKDNDTKNNKLDNLMLLSQSERTKIVQANCAAIGISIGFQKGNKAGDLRKVIRNGHDCSLTVEQVNYMRQYMHENNNKDKINDWIVEFKASKGVIYNAICGRTFNNSKIAPYSNLRDITYSAINNNKIANMRKDAKNRISLTYLTKKYKLRKDVVIQLLTDSKHDHLAPPVPDYVVTGSLPKPVNVIKFKTKQLTDREVALCRKEIRNKSGKFKLSEYSTVYGVSPATFFNAMCGHTFKHVQVPPVKLRIPESA